MDITVTPTPIDSLLVVQPGCFRDERGFTMSSYEKQVYFARGITYEFVVDVHTRSVKDVLRGFHFQDGSAPMAKLARCTVGAILDVVVDLRMGSPTFGQTFAIELSAENHTQLMIPPEFGHGFCALSEVAEVQYKLSNYYVPKAEGTIAWNDPEIGFAWPVAAPILSRRDQAGISLAAYRERPAFLYPPYGGSSTQLA
jgi:dTDP-4-dehydrorhamnose 3,5-epimerase